MTVTNSRLDFPLSLLEVLRVLSHAAAGKHGQKPEQRKTLKQTPAGKTFHVVSEENVVRFRGVLPVGAHLLLHTHAVFRDDDALATTHVKLA